MASTSTQEWIDVFVELAEQEGEITPEQADAIGDFIVAVLGGFTPINVLRAVGAFRKFTKDGEEGENPEINEDLEERVTALENWVNAPKLPRPRNLPRV